MKRSVEVMSEVYNKEPFEGYITKLVLIGLIVFIYSINQTQSDGDMLAMVCFSGYGSLRKYKILWAYLKQPLFKSYYSPILNPRRFAYFYKLQHLEDCYHKTDVPDHPPKPSEYD